MTATPIEPRRGEVWRVEFDPARGAEIRKTRPAVVVNVETAGKLPLRVIVPLTNWHPAFARAFWMVQISPDAGNGLHKMSAADTFQIRSFSLDRFVEKIGELTQEQLTQIVQCIGRVIGDTVVSSVIQEGPPESKSEEQNKGPGALSSEFDR